MLFVDYWNLQVTLQKEDGKLAGLADAGLRAHRFAIDWFGLGPKLTALAAEHATPTPGTPLPLAFQESRIYTSTDATNAKFRHWATNSLGRQPGVRVHCLDRRPKQNPDCPHCYDQMNTCPNCKQAITATQEKGVDTLLVTDLLRLGLDGSYDVALLVSQDSDMAPAAEHLGTKGIKVIHVGIKHYGNGVASRCWAGFDLLPHRTAIQRI